MTNIYKITNIVNGNIYIGKTINNINDRWKEHIYSAISKDKDGNCPLHCAIRKYGKENFLIELIDRCEDFDSSNKEKYWIKYYDSYNNGYNATLGGDGNPLYDREYIKKLWDDGLSNKEIREIIGCDKKVIRKTLYSYGITKEELYKRRGKNIEKDIDKDYLKELWDEELTLTQIAEIFNVEQKTIMRRLEKIGIDSNQRHNRYYDSLLKVHWSVILNLYKEGKTISEIRKITGCGFNSIEKTIIRHRDYLKDKNEVRTMADLLD